MSFVTRTLRSMPLGFIIGGPMTAAIEAQGLAAQSTVDFIKSVGFDPPVVAGGGPAPALTDVGSVRNVTFRYSRRSVAQPAAGGAIALEVVELTVPILTIVPIPYIRIDEMTIDFSVDITEHHEDSVNLNAAHTAAVNTDTSFSSKFGNFLTPVKVGINAKVSTRSQTSISTNIQSSNRNNVDAKLDIHLRAVQDDMPGGLKKILDILQAAILENNA